MVSNQTITNALPLRVPGLATLPIVQVWFPLQVECDEHSLQVVFNTGPTLLAGLILHGGNEGYCLRCPLPLPWCPWNAPVEIYNFLIGCHLPKRKYLGALAHLKMKHTALDIHFFFIIIIFFTNNQQHQYVLTCTVHCNQRGPLLQGFIILFIFCLTILLLHVLFLVSCVHLLFSKAFHLTMLSSSEFSTPLFFEEYTF